MLNKLAREIDGYKFYSTAHGTKEAAALVANAHNSPVYDSVAKAWYNMNCLGGISYQEDFLINEAIK